MNKYTNVLVTLIASIIYTLLAIIKNENAMVWAYNLVLVMMFSIIFGTILKIYLEKKVFLVEDEEVESEENTNTDIENMEVKNDEKSETENYFESLKE